MTTIVITKHNHKNSQLLQQSTRSVERVTEKFKKAKTNNNNLNMRIVNLQNQQQQQQQQKVT